MLRKDEEEEKSEKGDGVNEAEVEGA